MEGIVLRAKAKVWLSAEIVSTPPASTIFTAMGISPKTAYEVEKRPFFATKDGTGKPAMDIFA
ncbi:MAG: hypothetical protein MK290_02160 [Pedosphaera sp.]|nr:hypothetical protein [Pedosphaera sp.]